MIKDFLRILKREIEVKINLEFETNNNYLSYIDTYKDEKVCIIIMFLKEKKKKIKYS